jgi:hypothetical protein
MNSSSEPTVRSEEPEGFVAKWQAWHNRRLVALGAPAGPPSLVATYWLAETSEVPGVPGIWSEREGGVELVLAPGITALVDGVRISGRVVALARGDLVGRLLDFASVTVQVTTREGQRGVRVFDHGRADRLQGVGTMPPDPRFVLEGLYEPLAERASVNYSYALESSPREVEVPGLVRFSLGGKEYAVNPLLDEGSLLLVFADRTTGNRTRPPSRFLVVAPPTQGLDLPGMVRLDFNRAYLPPCAFSDEFNCPLPPSHHHFDVEILAGETWPQFADFVPTASRSSRTR